MRGLVAGLALAVTGCATFPPLAGTAGVDGEYAEWMTTGEVHAALGEVDSAVAAFHTAASHDPARKEPWLRIARLRAGNDEPAQAMIAAGEVLRRDPGDASANDIYLASGLEIAVDALRRLRASDGERHARFQPQAEALMELLAQVYALRDMLPEPVVDELVQEAVEQWKREHPQESRPGDPPASPLDILGGD